MEDYESGERLTDENVNINLTMFAADDGDPNHFDDVVKIEKCRKAMYVEMKAIKINGTWKLTELPKESNKVGVKWVYKKKFEENGEVDKHTTRLVVKGYYLL